MPNSHKFPRRNQPVADGQRSATPRTRRAHLGEIAGTIAVLAGAACGKSSSGSVGDVLPPSKDKPKPTKPEPRKPFRVRSSEERVAAVGRLDGLSPQQRRSFEVGKGAFRPLGEPRPGDWLAEHHEPGQTYDEWVSSKPNVAREPRNVIDLLPLGQWSDEAPTTQTLQSFTQAYFGLQVRVRPTATLDGLPIKRRKRGSWDQLLTTDVNDWLQTQLRPDTYCALAVTMTDLYPAPRWNFVFGQARLFQRVGVFSFARHNPGFAGKRRSGDWRKTWLRRSLDTLAHETGHMFGASHCVFYECLLNGSNSLDESDRGTAALCPVCLRKLHKGAGFDVERRYEQLVKFYDAHALEERATWIRQRLTWIRQG